MPPADQGFYQPRGVDPRRPGSDKYKGYSDMGGGIGGGGRRVADGGRYDQPPHLQEAALQQQQQRGRQSAHDMQQQQQQQQLQSRSSSYAPTTGQLRSGHIEVDTLYAGGSGDGRELTVNSMNAPNNSTMQCGCENIDCPFCNQMMSIQMSDAQY